MSNNNFIKLTEQEQKVEFMKTKGEKEIVNEALVCSKKNEEITEDSKHRFEN